MSCRFPLRAEDGSSRSSSVANSQNQRGATMPAPRSSSPRANSMPSVRSTRWTSNGGSRGRTAPDCCQRAGTLRPLTPSRRHRRRRGPGCCFEGGTAGVTTDMCRRPVHRSATNDWLQCWTMGQPSGGLDEVNRLLARPVLALLGEYAAALTATQAIADELGVLAARLAAGDREQERPRQAL